MPLLSLHGTQIFQLLTANHNPGNAMHISLVIILLYLSILTFFPSLFEGPAHRSKLRDTMAKNYILIMGQEFRGFRAIMVKVKGRIGKGY